MEELTKTQIVLLTLLVSFVTSIATGIVTVALVDQSSQGVGQTIQTVIQRTIETVVPTTPTENKPPVSVKVTPPPSESDLIVQAVSKNSSALVRILKTKVAADQSFSALGIVLDKNGVILSDKGLLADKKITYFAVFADGKTATLTPATALNASTTYGAVFTFTPPSSASISAVSLGDSDNLSGGQKVIALSGATKDVVQLGVISDFDKGSTNHDKAFINTDFDTSTKAFGTILLNLSGEVIGMKTSINGVAGFSFSAINLLKSEIK